MLGSCLSNINQPPLLVANTSFVFPSVTQFNPNLSSSSLASDSSSSSSSSSSSLPSPRTPSSPVPTASITAIAPPSHSMVTNAAKLSQCPNLPDSFLLEVVNRYKRPLTKRKSSANLNAAFKGYYYTLSPLPFYSPRM